MSATTLGRGRKTLDGEDVDVHRSPGLDNEILKLPRDSHFNKQLIKLPYLLYVSVQTYFIEKPAVI